MNIFLVMLISVFMAGYYMFFAPSARIPEQETEYAISVSDLRSIAECAIAVHNAQIAGTTFNDVCIEQNGIKTEFVCMDSRQNVTACVAVDGRVCVLVPVVHHPGESHAARADCLEREERVVDGAQAPAGH